MSSGVEEAPDLGMENPECCGKWEKMGQTLKEFSDPVAWDFLCEQIQNPDELRKYLQENQDTMFPVTNGPYLL